MTRRVDRRADRLLRRAEPGVTRIGHRARLAAQPRGDRRLLRWGSRSTRWPGGCSAGSEGGCGRSRSSVFRVLGVAERRARRGRRRWRRGQRPGLSRSPCPRAGDLAESSSPPPPAWSPPSSSTTAASRSASRATPGCRASRQAPTVELQTAGRRPLLRAGLVGPRWPGRSARGRCAPRATAGSAGSSSRSGLLSVAVDPPRRHAGRPRRRRPRPPASPARSRRPDRGLLRPARRSGGHDARRPAARPRPKGGGPLPFAAVPNTNQLVRKGLKRPKKKVTTPGLKSGQGRRRPLPLRSGAASAPVSPPLRLRSRTRRCARSPVCG